MLQQIDTGIEKDFFLLRSKQDEIWHLVEAIYKVKPNKANYFEIYIKKNTLSMAAKEAVSNFPCFPKMFVGSLRRHFDILRKLMNFAVFVWADSQLEASWA